MTKDDALAAFDDPPLENILATPADSSNLRGGEKTHVNDDKEVAFDQLVEGTGSGDLLHLEELVSLAKTGKLEDVFDGLTDISASSSTAISPLVDMLASLDATVKDFKAHGDNTGRSSSEARRLLKEMFGSGASESLAQESLIGLPHKFPAIDTASGSPNKRTADGSYIAQYMRQLAKDTAKIGLPKMFSSSFSPDIGRRRLNHDGTCEAPCDPNTATCNNCDLLAHCVRDLSVYDFSALFLKGQLSDEGMAPDNPEACGKNMFDSGSCAHDSEFHPLSRKIAATTQGANAIINNNGFPRQINSLSFPSGRSREGSLYEYQNSDEVCADTIASFHIPCDAVGQCDEHSMSSTIMLSADEVCDGIKTTDRIKFTEIARVYDTFADALPTRDGWYCWEPPLLYGADNLRNAIAVGGARIDTGNDDVNVWLEGKLSPPQKLERQFNSYPYVHDDRLEFVDDCIQDSRKCGFPPGIQNMDVPEGLPADTINAGDWYNHLFHVMLRDEFDRRLLDDINEWVDNCTGKCTMVESGIYSGGQRRASTQACEEFVTCTETLWRANPDLGSGGDEYTRDHYPFKCGEGEYSDTTTKDGEHPWNVDFPGKWENLQWPSKYSSDVNVNPHGQPNYYRDPQNCLRDGDKIFDYFPNDWAKTHTVQWAYTDVNGNVPSYPAGVYRSGTPFSLGPMSDSYTRDVPTCGPFAWKYREDVRCDTAMSLIFGDTTSVGQICSVASAVSEKGPERMPGRCCLDTPKSAGNLAMKVSITAALFKMIRLEH